MGEPELKRLAESTLRGIELRNGIEVSGYPRSKGAKVLHVGVGAFHRGHLAPYFDTMNAQIDEPWLIHGASLQTPRAGHQLNPQDGLFLHQAQGADNPRYRLIRSLLQVGYVAEEPDELIAHIAAPTTQLLTLTITEKGYCLDTVTGLLDQDHPLIQHDLTTDGAPQTAIGFMVRGLQERRAGAGGPLTILSCDNLIQNGRRCREAVLSFAELWDPTLTVWIEAQVRFPSSVVDRICPAVTEADRARAQQLLTLEDRGTVVAEDFCEWVIEDDFAGAKPPLELAGVTWVDNVAPFESRKLRLLNAGHSALAYLGGLLGLSTVHDAIVTPTLAEFINDLWLEIGATLDGDAASSAPDYCAALLTRFANPNLDHPLEQIGTDGSQKLPLRIIAPLQERLEQGLASPRLTEVVAAWLYWHWGTTLSGAPLSFSDPLAAQFKSVLGQQQRCTVQAATDLARSYPPLAALLERFPPWESDLGQAFASLPEKLLGPTQAC